MLFNSLTFLWFFPTVFLLYWFVFNKSLRIQNAFILLASYVFYGWWDWRFLSLIAFSTVIDYLVGLKIFEEQNPKNRKMLLIMSLGVNLGLLGFFKYYNFFAESLSNSLRIFDIELDPITLKIVLPVGISFYTFQTMSYSIDIYKNKLKPTKDFIAFAAFVSFFPQLVAGPIERAANLLPQVLKPRNFDADRAKSGLGHIIYGLFKKVVIADNLAFFVNDVFGSESSSFVILSLAAIAFGIQIYCDFSGYSDIAIGISRLLGFDLMTNFNFPYFAKNITEFWRRWHISLSTWFRDYVYIPLGGNRGSKIKVVRNTLIIFIVSGFWHGANWTFIIWGAIHSLLFIPTIFLKDKVSLNFGSTRINNFLTGLFTFTIVTIAWIFFRAENLDHAYAFIVSLMDFNFNLNDVRDYRIMATEGSILEVLFILSLFLLGELWTRHRKYNFNFIESAIIFVCIAYFGNFFNPSSFIYFQF